MMRTTSSISINTLSLNFSPTRNSFWTFKISKSFSGRVWLKIQTRRICCSNHLKFSILTLKVFDSFLDLRVLGYINSKKIKEIFDIFDENITHEEIQSTLLNPYILLILDVLKFIGIKNDKMSFDKFQDFYKKNLWK